MKTSETPQIMYCGSIHSTLRGIISSGRSTSSSSLATWSRRLSTRAATTIMIIERNIPTPVLWSILKPNGVPVILLVTGTMTQS
ncbi:hypothetical protein MRB53_018304 [Persea americana]|uniref:Uncharacterized protein n=1 Tax=Persea americana TaxID=3435 RepID=A0ACC2M7K8_PERAE|nr:hypothetical protein MRB53_018304 [Persea americana]